MSGSRSRIVSLSMLTAWLIVGCAAGKGCSSDDTPSQPTTTTTGAGSAVVPNIVGDQQTAAATALSAAGLVVGTVTTQASSSTAAAGTIVSESPVAGTKVTAGSAVNVVVALGSSTTVPNVVGLTQAAATTAIGSAGLTVGTTTMQSSTTVGAGLVISQTPPEGTSVATNSAVNLVVSSGPPPVVVPNVVGSTQQAASSALTAVGLKAGTVTTQLSTSVPAGQVISESPSAGASVTYGSSVDLVVAKSVPGPSGTVESGTSPVSGATIQLYAVGTSADGSAATPLISSTVQTDSAGQFSIGGLFTCPTAGSLVYITASGGSVTGGSGGSAAVLMTALGACSSLTTSTDIWVNEVTTAASVFALSPYMQSASSIGSSGAHASALATAFSTVSEFVNTATGATPGPGLPAGQAVDVPMLNTLGNLLASCIDASAGCPPLLSDSTPPSAAAPTNTASATLDIANNPTNNVSELYSLADVTIPYTPALGCAPASLTPVIYPASDTSVWPDVATVNGNNTVVVSNGSGAFAVLAVDVGASCLSSLTVRVIPSASLAATATLCQTQPTTGQCLNSPAASVALSSLAPGGSPSYSVFVTATGTIPSNPANNVVVQITDATNAILGSATVLVTSSP